ncbi:MAG: O-antigen ligase family protein [Bacteroidetes bacterium]|nr:O-antigen ligase family protein [Bacteroidota bacterium]
MTRIEFHRKSHYFIAILIAFTLPFGKFTPLFIGLLLINWIVEADFKTKFNNFIKNKLAILFVSLYLIHVLGLIYTNNMASGLFDIQVKLSLLIFPLIFASRPLTKAELSNVFCAFTIGLVYASIYMISRAVSLYFIEYEVAFFYKEFSALIHTSYISMYMNLAIVWLLITLFNKEHEQLFSKISSSFLILFFSFIIVLLASKSGILTLVLIYIGILLYFILYKKNYLVGVIGILLIAFSLVLVSRFAPVVTNRIDSFLGAIHTESNTETTESTSVRMLIWESSNQVIKNNFLLGVGTGDAKDVLNDEYSKKNISNALNHNLNAHNEFYQIFICLGVVGFIILVLNLFYPIIYYSKTADYLYVIFLLIITFNFLSEAFFNSIFGLKHNENIENKKI